MPDQPERIVIALPASSISLDAKGRPQAIRIRKKAVVFLGLPWGAAMTSRAFPIFGNGQYFGTGVVQACNGNLSNVASLLTELGAYDERRPLELCIEKNVDGFKLMFELAAELTPDALAPTSDRAE